MTELVRPPATETDKAVFNQLLERISAVDSYFCCGGTLQLIDRPLTLYYKSESGKNGWLDFGNLVKQSTTDRENAINSLLEACLPAPHGKGDETVLDESYRLARQLSWNDFALNIDLTGEIGSGVLSSISAMTAGRFVLFKSGSGESTIPQTTIPNLTVIPRLYTLNAYAKGGFFRPHRDTPKGNDHIGTLMIALPIAHQGGALRVKHDGKEILFDWQEQCSTGLEMQFEGEGEGEKGEGDSKLKITLPWAFLFSDVEHEVLPVVSGTRVTIAYDIFTSPSNVPMSINLHSIDGVDGPTIPLYEHFLAAWRNPSFLVHGGKVAIALSHSYPMAREYNVKRTGHEFSAGLKGIDAIVYRAMKAAGFDVHLHVVMEVTDEDQEYDCSGIPEDGYGPSLGQSDYGFNEYLVTSWTFKYEDCTDLEVQGDTDYKTAAKKVFDADLDQQLMWIKKPRGTFVDSGTYLAYGNQANIDFFYAAATFLLNIPPYGTGSRVFS